MSDTGPRRTGSLSIRVRLALFVLLLTAMATLWVTNSLLSDRFTETTRTRAELRLAVYSETVMAELGRNEIIAELLARDRSLISALNAQEFRETSRLLISLLSEIEAKSLRLLDKDGLTVATTDRNGLRENHRTTPYFVDALRSNITVFNATEREVGGFLFTHSRRLESAGDVVGVIVVEVDLAKFERQWKAFSGGAMITNSEGQIILATEQAWLGKTPEMALSSKPLDSTIARFVAGTADWTFGPDTYLGGEAVMEIDGRIPHQGWKLTTFTAYSSIRERVNAVLALEIMAFAILAALVFYTLSRRTAFRAALFQRESAELRQLNARLQREISERERVQKNLAVAEQSLAQSSKLAALGEMSAAVSHELNQPLAAMKTYLAGARLLLRRNRPDEAVGAFHRIDDLIERMGAITRQLKSYARKGQDALSPVDLAEALSSSMTMMEPQLKARRVRITRILPDAPVLVMGDRMRIEQVLVNLLRNALDATKTVDQPQIEIILAAGETAILSVRDNGHGIEDLESLFEPFYTTKQPGDGVGLGLAISSGIVSDLGGRLMARNGEQGGAVFEMQMPIHTEQTEAAE